MGPTNGAWRIVRPRPFGLAVRHDQHCPQKTAYAQPCLAKSMRPFELHTLEVSGAFASRPYIRFRQHPPGIAARPIEGAGWIGVRGNDGRIRARDVARSANAYRCGEDHDCSRCDEPSHPLAESSARPELPQPATWLAMTPCGCGREDDSEERGWRAYLGDADDGGDEVLVFVRSAARERVRRRLNASGWPIRDRNPRS